jgi:hypothetical protein
MTPDRVGTSPACSSQSGPDEGLDKVRKSQPQTRADLRKPAPARGAKVSLARIGNGTCAHAGAGPIPSTRADCRNRARPAHLRTIPRRRRLAMVPMPRSEARRFCGGCAPSSAPPYPRRAPRRLGRAPGALSVSPPAEGRARTRDREEGGDDRATRQCRDFLPRRVRDLLLLRVGTNIGSGHVGQLGRAGRTRNLLQAEIYERISQSGACTDRTPPVLSVARTASDSEERGTCPVKAGPGLRRADNSRPIRFSTTDNCAHWRRKSWNVG